MNAIENLKELLKHQQNAPKQNEVLAKIQGAQGNLKSERMNAVDGYGGRKSEVWYQTRVFDYIKMTGLAGFIVFPTALSQPPKL